MLGKIPQHNQTRGITSPRCLGARRAMLDFTPPTSWGYPPNLRAGVNAVQVSDRALDGKIHEASEAPPSTPTV